MATKTTSRKTAPTPPPPVFDISHLSEYRMALQPTFTEIRLDRAEGQPPLLVTIRDNLSFPELDDLPRGAGATFEASWPKVAGYVVGWNVRATNLVTGEEVEVPPPSEVGPEVFKLLTPREAAWIILRIRTAHLGDAEQKKDVNAPDTTDDA